MTAPTVSPGVPPDLWPPIAAYRGRAANRSALDAVRDHSLPPEPSVYQRLLTRLLAGTVVNTFYADISYYQRLYTAAYRQPITCYRLDWGGGYDSNAAGNHAFSQAAKSVQVEIAYSVFKPGEGKNLVNRVKNFYGAKAPHKLVSRWDMESGELFAGAGDHSSEANWVVGEIADYLGSEKRVDGYANGYDWKACWPGAPAWLKRAVASYSSTDPGGYSWQFYGGDPRWPSPAGYPRSMAPFGAYVDLNVIHKPIGQIVRDYGLAPVRDEIDMATLKQLKAVVSDAVNSTVTDAVAAAETSLTNHVRNIVGNAFRAVLTGKASGGFSVHDNPVWIRPGGVYGELDAIKAELAALKAKVK